MAIERTESLIHWNFFLALEEDLERLARFVDLSSNETTFSIEIARLFLSACAETDSILKQLARKMDPDSRAASINAYHTVVPEGLPYFKPFEAKIPRYRLTLRPWDTWSQDQPPYWWQDHNKVKHHRHENFERANLKNCLNAVAALYCVTLHLYAEEAEAGELYSVPRLFITGPVYAGGSFVHESGINLVYRNLKPE